MMAVLVLSACAGVDDPDTPAEPTSGSFRVLSYNVQGLPDLLSESDLLTEDRMALISPRLEDFDLVGLQEDFDAENHGLVVAGVTHPVQDWFNAKVAPERVYGSGLAQLSRVGVALDAFEEHFDQCHGLVDAGSDCLASKGFQVLRLSLGGAELDVYNTHQEAGGGDEDDAVRGSQVQQILTSMETRSEGRAVILMGDTNLRWTDPADVDDLQAYADAGLRDACTEVDCPEGDHIDRILVRDGGGLSLAVDAWSRDTTFVSGDEPLSDHPAITADLSWVQD